MLVNLSDVLTTEGKTETAEIALEMTEFSNGSDTCRVKEKSPVHLTFANIGEGKAHIEGSGSLVLAAVCDRCLTEVDLPITLSFDRVVLSPEAAAEDEDAEADDQLFMDGYQLDVEAFVHDEIIVNWPVKILCKEDCKGVCPVCGQNLNERECGCDTFVPDPRMAAIKDIFNANKEV
ncbi:MAG: DUF177 domain-containing protein [Lachnospiraceae bacterium]|nr:DUF177 domain-containing protein [Lachnospiraceae bacterium]